LGKPRLAYAARTIGGLIALLTAGSLLASCGAVGARKAVPLALEDSAHVSGMEAETIRFWGDELPPNTAAFRAKRVAQLTRSRSDLRGGGRRPVMNSLALSGGGPLGAYGAGVLAGWTAAGTRPKFDVVTGVSAGALTAPFAFLGPKYDPALKHVFTESHTNDIAVLTPVRGILGGSAMSSNAPLAKIIAHYVTPSFLAEVAAEHRKGRRLLIGTTNLDAGRPVIWDMGEIALSGRPGSVELFREVLLASAAIPAAFPPSFIKVTADGYSYEEMHVDGGTTRSVFLAPTELTLSGTDAALGVRPVRRFYVIMNGWVTPQRDAVKPRTMAIAGRAVSTLLKNQGVGDLYRLYAFCKRNGIDYNLAYIPGDVQDTSTAPFDPVFMTELYDVGYRMARQGYPWQKQPPEL
jgi:predicted acylesterase/phospholipase RssA